jgi:hypothetical protein
VLQGCLLLLVLMPQQLLLQMLMPLLELLLLGQLWSQQPWFSWLHALAPTNSKSSKWCQGDGSTLRIR